MLLWVIAVAILQVGSSSSAWARTNPTPPTPSPRLKKEQSLPALAQASMSQAIGQDQAAYHATRLASGIRLQNRSHDFSVSLDAGGIELRRGSDRWGMALREFGRGEQPDRVKATPPIASKNRVEYQRGALTEWYSNGPLGLEQGFTLPHPPRGTGEGPLVLGFELSGNLTTSIDPGARSLSLARQGVATLQYAGLTAIDARGTALPAWLELDGRALRLRVDDAGAEYPVTIDPVLGAVKLTNNKALCTIGGICDRGNAGDRFGFAVAISGDGATVAVSAPHATGGNVDSGAVYVFRRPSFGGWNGCITINCLDFVAKLTIAPIQHGFGASVAISGDGNTIVALLDTLGNPDSSAGVLWVFQKPASGWASTSLQNAILSVTTVTETPCGFSATDPNDCITDFTSSIDVNGDGSTVAFGYSGGLVGGIARGAVYVFVRPATGWVNSASPVKLTRAGGAHLDLLGQAVAISDDGSTIVAAAPQANGFLGAALVFVKGGSGWVNATQTAELTYAPGNGLLFLGNGVDVSSDGSTAVVGGNGRALIFGQTSQRICFPTGICAVFFFWANAHETAILSTSDGSPVAWPRISGDGSRVVASGFESPGMVYAYIRPDTGWASATQGARFGAVDGAPGDLLGHTSIPGTPAIAISTDGSTLLAGASGATIGGNVNQGAAYLFLPEPGGLVALSVGALALGAMGSRKRRTACAEGSGSAARAERC